MAAELCQREDIPKLATQVGSPAAYWVLRYLQKAGFLMNSKELGEKIDGILRRLKELGLIDPGYAVLHDGSPSLWTINANGFRVLKHIEASPALQEALRPGFRIHDRARTALTSLSDQDQLKVLLAVDALLALEPSSWPDAEATRLGNDHPAYLLPVTPELRAFVRVLDSGDVELLDLVQEETLRLFLEKQHAGSKVG